MEKIRFKPKELLPYRMLLTRLFKHVVSVSPELDFDHYLLHDRAMHPLALLYERKTRADRGTKRPRESNASSSPTTQNQLSSSHPLDHMVEENDDDHFTLIPLFFLNKSIIHLILLLESVKTLLMKVMT
ncbi:hypothetical protein Tco_1267055 [Tanacetum coccineum]